MSKSKKKKVAFCYSGCFRNFQDIVGQHLEFSNFLLEKWGIEADIYRFACFWSFNQLTPNWEKYPLYLKQNGIVDEYHEKYNYPSKLNVPVPGNYVESVMRNRDLKWAAYKFVPFQVYLSVKEHYSHTVKEVFSQHYAMKEVMKLRRKYEQQHGAFDIVVWLRSDKPYAMDSLGDEERLPLPKKFGLEIFGEKFPIVEEERDWNALDYFPIEGFRDQIFYGNGHSMDIAVNCYGEPIEGDSYPKTRDTRRYVIEEHFLRNLTENGISVQDVPLWVSDWVEWQSQCFKVREGIV